MQKTKSSSCFNTQEIAALFSTSLEGNTSYLISTDSRTIQADQIFLPLTGEKFDGHNFINDVLEKGIKYSFCEKGKTSKVKEEYKSNLIVVENTLDAYHRLANYYRKKTNPKVIAITGSSGKTTVKDLIASVLLVKYKTHKTEANFNNEFGVPKTILEMPLDAEVLVLELAMRGKGEIGYLSKTVEPDIAVITNIGAAHIGRLGSIEEIIKAKCEIFEYLKKGGCAIIPNDPILIKNCKGVLHDALMTADLNQVVDIVFVDGKSYFKFEEKEFYVSALGKTHILNSIFAILVARHLGLTDEEIQEGLNNFKVPQGRGNILKLSTDVYIVDESYNANPDSVRAAISNLIDCWGKEFKKVLVLGELAELGEQEERLLDELKDWIEDKPLDNIITVGDKLKRFKMTGVADTGECCAILKKMLAPKTAVLIKGSHVAGLEKIIEELSK